MSMTTIQTTQHTNATCFPGNYQAIDLDRYFNSAEPTVWYTQQSNGTHTEYTGVARVL